MAETKDNKEASATPKGFRFLLILIMLTWLVLAGEVMINSLGGENQNTLSMQSDANSVTIEKVQIKISGLQKALIQVDKRLEKVEDELDKALKTFLNPSFVPSNKKDDEISSKEQPEEKISDKEQPQAKETQQAETTATKEKEVSFEYMSFEPESLTAGLTEVSDRTAVLEEKIFQVNESLKKATANERANEMVLAAIHLRESVKNGEEYEQQLYALKNLAKDDEEMQKQMQILEDNAKTGVMRLSQLQSSFDEIIDEINLNKRNSKENPNIWEKAIAQFSGLVKIRKIEASAGANTTEDILARGYQKLLISDIEGAINEINNLNDKDKAIAQEWIKKAKSSVLVRDAAENIFRYVTNPSFAQYYEKAE